MAAGMAETYCETSREKEGSPKISRAARRRRMELRRLRVLTGVPSRPPPVLLINNNDDNHMLAKFGIASICGRRRDMEDAVAIHLSFIQKKDSTTDALHFFGVYDGHGCSHVATKCQERLHEMVKEELLTNNDGIGRRNGDEWWKYVMDRSFSRMDREVITCYRDDLVDDDHGTAAACRCEMQSLVVGSAAVVSVVTPHKIVVANCGDSRAVLCRNGVSVPLSADHKPDRPDELGRIEAAGGRVIYWEGARVFGVLAMSRAIGDHYLRPFVISEPEVTITQRREGDECLILASDGLWDVVSNETACCVAHMCLNGKGEGETTTSSHRISYNYEDGAYGSDKYCDDASIVLTKMALARRSSDNISVVVVDLRQQRTCVNVVPSLSF